MTDLPSSSEISKMNKAYNKFCKKRGIYNRQPSISVGKNTRDKIKVVKDNYFLDKQDLIC